MARRRKIKRRRTKAIPIAPLVGVIGGVFGGGKAEMLLEGKFGEYINELTKDMTGFNINTKTWNPGEMINGLAPILAGAIVHKIVGGWLGVNKVLARYKVPIRI